MRNPYDTAAQSMHAQERVLRLFASQQQACADAPYPAVAQRRTDLRALRRQLHRYRDLLTTALNADFGTRSVAESEMLDLLGSTLEINHAISHLGKWSKPRRRTPELLFMSNSLQVMYQPKGVVGVIVPWNFPVYLALGPLTAALAAGNRVMIKMSELTPATNAVVRTMLGEIFAEEQVAVCGEELSDPAVFSSLAFDHLIFTGSPAVGRVVMRAAAASLTPVTLELGGKSPALVLPDYSMADAAQRIAHGKASNAGQICVAPDYALVPRAQVDIFVKHVQAAFRGFYQGEAAGNGDYTSVISEKHYERLLALLEDARSKGARVTACGELGTGRQLPLHIVTGCTPAMALMQEEIFGPILPVLAYDTLDEAIAHIGAGPRPLALYCFSHDARARAEVLRRTHSGGVSINDWGWHAINHDAPFGGIGNSGMGSYHGEEGFRELSHAKTVFKRHRWFPIGLFYPPYGRWVQKLALSLFLGKADPQLQAAARQPGTDSHLSRTAMSEGAP